MTRPLTRRRALQALALAAGLAGLPSLHAAEALPADSVYQLDIPLTDQSGRASRLAERRGRPLLMSMFYTSCQFVCPMLIDAMRATVAALPEAERGRVDVLLVSFDPARDSVAVLRKTAAERHLDGTHWSLARSDAASVRKLAAVLGVQYRLLPDGEFNHSTQLVLLDPNGRVLGRTAKLDEVDAEFLALLKKAAR